MAISFLVLWVFRTQQFTGDSLWYAKDALNGTQMFHPHHLIFTPSMRGFLLAITFIGIDLTILEAGQLFNISFAAFTVGLIHRTLRSVVSPGTSFLIPIILLFCNGFWSYSTQIEVYIPSIFFSLLMLWALKGNSLGTSRIIVAILAFALATLFHQTNVLLAGPLFIVLGRYSWKKAVLISTGAGMLVLGTYIWAMNQEGLSINLNGFKAFCLKYAVSGQKDWGTFSNWMPMGWFELFASQTGNIIRQSYAHVVFYWFIVTLGIIWLIIFGFRELQQKSVAQSLIVFSLSWIIINYLFFLWWLPKEGEFFIASLIPLSILLAIHADKQVWQFKQFTLPTILMVIVGFNAYAFYQKHSQPNQFGQRAKQLAAFSDKNTVVITDFFTEQYLEFFHHVKAENTDIVYHEIYENNHSTLIDSINRNKRLIISHQHISPEFKVNGFNGISHRAEWEAGVQLLLKNACSLDQFKILNEDFLLIERCEEPQINIDSALIVLGITGR